MNNTVHNIACAFALGLSALAAVAQTGHVDPPGWWGDLEEGKVEVLVSHPDLGVPRDVETKAEGVTLLNWRPSTLPGHVWIELDVSGVQEAGEVALNVLPQRGRWTSFPFQVVPSLPDNRLDRWEDGPAMYLIMPDRFANGDPSNDDVAGQLERGIDRTEMYARHGGDLAGVESKLDYLEELGIGAVWMTPVVANDLAKTSYHGYACTDSYEVDPRLGTLDAYKSLSAAAHERGIRIVHDWVPNHWGNLHRLLTHPVDSAWVHNWAGGFTDDKRTNYRSGVVLDPHGQTPDVAGFNDGWFDRMMPDMNQANADLQRYMGTNILWWMAEVGIDGLRIDTYTYGQQDAMAAMTKRVSLLSRTVSCSRKLGCTVRPNRPPWSKERIRLGPDHRPGRCGGFRMALRDARGHGTRRRLGARHWQSLRSAGGGFPVPQPSSVGDVSRQPRHPPLDRRSRRRRQSQSWARDVADGTRDALPLLRHRTGV